MGEDWEQDVLEEARQTIIRSRGQIKFPIRSERSSRDPGISYRLDPERRWRRVGK
jgi:hypothetical protein